MEGIIDFSEAPLSIVSWFGIIMTGVSVLVMVFLAVRRICFGDPVAGWASIVCIILLIGGIQLFSLGIMGQYLAKTYTEVKKRPHYIISESNKEDCVKIK